MAKRKSAYHHGDLRAALLETTATLIEEGGVGKVTMRQLSDRIGVSRMAPYRHFADKNTLLCAVAEVGFQRLRAINTPILASEGNGLDKLKRLACAYVDFAIENAAYYRLMFGAEVVSAPPIELRAAAQSSFDESMVVVILASQESGLIHAEDPLVLANIIWSTIHGLSLLIIDGQIRAEDMAHTLLDDEASRVKGDSHDPRHFVTKTVDVMIAGFRNCG
ncbi:MAG: TetR/AcrR family transcriptional regulator [bacterium]|nr:TetR/AcrR family transcriptional regulator [bacterium]